MKKINIDEVDINKRIDSFISEKEKDVSRVRIKSLIEDGNILVNNSKVKPSYKIKENDIIEIEIPEVVEESHMKAQDIDLDVIYEDNDIIVINKAKGMVVHPGNGNADGTLANAVLAWAKGSLSGIGGEIRPGIVHRLDKDTSGIIIVAKNDKAHIDLSEQIKNREVTKKIYCFSTWCYSRR